MYVAKHYFETRFKQNFKKGDTVPDEIAKVYMKDVNELLIDNSSDVEIETSEDNLKNDKSKLEEDNLKNDKSKNDKSKLEEEIKSKFKSKEELEEYARTQGIELDRRKSMKNMIKDFLKFQ